MKRVDYDGSDSIKAYREYENIQLSRNHNIIELDV